MSIARISRRRSLSFDTFGLLFDEELGRNRQLVGRQPHRLFGDFLANAAQLEDNAPRLDDSDPVIRRALARAHARLGRLGRHRLVWEDANPDLAATLDVAV